MILHMAVAAVAGWGDVATVDPRPSLTGANQLVQVLGRAGADVEHPQLAGGRAMGRLSGEGNIGRLRFVGVVRQQQGAEAAPER